MAMIKNLSRIKEPTVSKLGGKGYTLAILNNNELNVPKGFIITSENFFEYLMENNLMNDICELISTIDEGNYQEKSKEIRNLILDGKISKKIKLEIENGLNKLNVSHVSIRSSAVSEDGFKSSFAGLYDTFLDVEAETNPVLQHLVKCWASLFNERAVIYRIKKNLPHMEGMAVVVQEMISADVSGIIFTVHPTDEKNMLLESHPGRGDLIVSGKVTPDSFVINRKSLKISEREVEKKGSSISDNTIGEIARKSLEVEKIFGYPQDIEWCISNNNIWLLQSRTITTSASDAKINSKKEPLLEGLGASPGAAEGKVKILLNPGEIDKVESGDILVTVMTNPLYVTAMQKANAIVTDVGGMICHAAIVARELGIPCVVGTKNATSVLRENMKVIVDGTEGKVHASDD